MLLRRLVPAAASVGVPIVFSSWGEAWGSALQPLLNVVVLIMVGAAGLSTQRRIWHWRTARQPAVGRHPAGRTLNSPQAVIAPHPRSR